MRKLSEMPLVTVEQITRFREAALLVEQQRDELLNAAKAVVVAFDTLPYMQQGIVPSLGIANLRAIVAKAGG